MFSIFIKIFGFHCLLFVFLFLPFLQFWSNNFFDVISLKRSKNTGMKCIFKHFKIQFSTRNHAPCFQTKFQYKMILSANYINFCYVSKRFCASYQKHFSKKMKSVNNLYGFYYIFHNLEYIRFYFTLFLTVMVRVLCNSL
jgi:hypothetical protein